MYTDHHQNCPFCKLVAEQPKYFIEENQCYLSVANIAPYSEGHVQIITKEPRTDITELTKEEWNNLLPILKNTIKSDINQLDTETWVQMGELFRKSVKEITEKLDARNLRVCIFLGKIGGLSQAETSWLQIHLVPRHKDKSTESKESIPVSEEILAIVEKLKKSSNQPKNLIEETKTQLESLDKNREQELLNEIEKLKIENEKLNQENQQLKEHQIMQQIQVLPKGNN